MSSTDIYSFALQNKYTKWYISITTNAKNKIIATTKNNLVTQAKKLPGYHEIHHIKPKSAGGTNALDNLVALTAREHFICHWLLTKMTIGALQKKMLHSLNMFNSNSNGQHRNLTSRQVAIAKQAQSKALKGVPSHKKGKPGKPWSEERKLKQRGHTWHHSEETKQRLRKPKKDKSNMSKPQELTQCPHCGKIGGAKTMPRWHFKNCKSLKE